MAEQEDFSKLSIDEKIQHKSWKARVAGYEELGKEFRKMDPDSQANEFRKYSSYMIKMAKDSNLPAQEAGMGCILSYVENAPNSERLRDELVPAIIQKGLGSARQGIRTRSIEILLMFVEVDVGEPIIELILPELSNKQPKIVAACVSTLKEITEKFGVRAVNIKGITKNLGKMFGHSDKTVRAEATALVLVIYSYIGKGVQSFLSDLKPVQVKELTAQFQDIPEGKARPPRLLRSQQDNIPEEVEVEAEGEDQVEDSLCDEPVNIDPYEFADPKDISSMIPSNFYIQLGAKKWQERKEVLEALEPVVNTIRLADSGPYGELIGALNTHINDTNVVVSILAINCIKYIALGLRQKFSAFKPTVLPTLLQKLKEKKQNFVDALRGCLDAVFGSVALVDVLEDILAMFPHKNPQIKAESVRFLIRILKTVKTPPTKSEIKKMCEGLLKTYEDGDTAVREASAECIGTLMKAVGERAVDPFIEGLDKIKSNKVKEYFDQAQVQVRAAPAAKPTPVAKPSLVKKPPPTAAARKPAPKTTAPETKPKIGLTKPPAKKPAAPTTKPSSTTKPSASKPPAKSGGSKKDDVAITYRFTSEDVEARIHDFLSASILEGIQSSAWKARLESMSQFVEMVETVPESELEPELLIRQLAKKPGWKEANFQVLSKMFQVVQVLAERHTKFTGGCAMLCLPTLIDKLGDIKLKKASSDAIDAIIERLSIKFVFSQSYSLISGQKSPKVLGDALLWVKQTINDFGISGLPVRPLVDFALGPLASSNATVRSNAVKLLAELRVYVGPEIRTFVQDVNQNLLNIIDTEFAKVGDRRPPTPTKGKATELPKEDDGPSAKDETDMLDDLFPRVDISPQINASLLTLLSSSNWKERKEGLDSIVQMIEASNKRITPALGELLPALKLRLEDKNLNLVVATLDLLGLVAEAVGKPYDKQGRAMVGPICNCINNPKAQNRTAAIGALSKMADGAGLAYMLGPIATSLNPELPLLRKDLTKWLSEKLSTKDSQLSDLSPLATPLMLCLQDKNADVRKGAQTCLSVVAEAIGYPAAKEKCLALKPSMQPPVMQILEGLKGKKSPSSAPRPPSRAAEATPKRAVGGLLRKPTTTPKASIAPVIPPVTTGLIIVSDKRHKDLRLSRERAGRWVFESPPSDLLDSVNEICQPCFAPELHRLMFSTATFKDKDFQSALSQLEKEVLTQRESFLNSSDLLFRYIAVRLYDQGTTTLIKCLDLLQLLFNLMSEEQCPLAENEAQIIFPSLISRLGVNNETLRKRVKDLLRATTSIYSSSSLITNLLEHGTKSKNARTRTEALEEMSHLIQLQGMTACPTPLKTLPVVASLISDRDAGVRNATINVITQVYILIGSKVTKYLTHLSEKERGYFEERFKRTKTNAPSPPPKLAPSEETDTHLFSFQKAPRAPPIRSPSLSPRQTPSPIASNQSPSPLHYQRRSPSPLIHPQRSPSISPQRSPLNNNNKPFSLSPLGPSYGGFDPEPRIRNITKLLSQDNEPIEALRELEKMMAGSADLLVPYANTLLESVCHAFDHLIRNSGHLDHFFTNCIRSLILTYLRLFETAALTNAFSADALKATIHSVVACLIDQKVKEYEAAFELSRHLNVLLVRLINNVPMTAVYEALFILLKQCLATDYRELVQEDASAANLHMRYAELIMKCTWKLTREIPSTYSQRGLNLSQLLEIVNNLYNSYPPSVLSKRAKQNDPIAGNINKTVKTVLYTLAGTVGSDILHELPPNSEGSHVSVMLRKLVDHIQIQNSKPPSLPPKESSDVNQALTDKLMEIMVMVDNSELNREGIQSLAQFQLENPSFQPLVDEQLEGRGTQFANFVKRSIANRNRNLALSTNNSIPVTASLSSPITQYHTPSSASRSVQSPDSALNLQRNQVEGSNPERDVTTPSPPPPQRQRTVGDLRARLAELRMSKSGSLS